jgi:hypothetical protein
VPLVVAVPLKATDCGEPLALSVIVSVPVRLPAVVGVKVTEMVQFAPAATELPQVCVSAKSPDAAIEVIESAAVPGLVRIVVCAALVVPVVCDVKVRADGESIIPGVGAIPVPFNTTIWGELGALSVMVTVPVRLPAAVGVNVTEMVQFAPAATLVPQVWVCAKSPDIAIEVTVKAVVPEFVSVTV